MEKLIKINPRDNVAVAISPLFKGDIITFDGATYTLINDLPAGHKMALQDIKEGEKVIKYGYPIGAATCDIPRGAHVHAFNIKTLLSEEAAYTYDEKKAQEYIEEARIKELSWKDKIPTIRAYERKNGDIGIRNELWIIPTVGCVNKIGEALCSWAQKNLGIEDGVHVWTHPFGCSQLGDDHDNTRHILANLVHHPNAGGVLVLSLGCENNTPESFRELVGEVDEERVKFLTCQKVDDEIAEGEKLLGQIADAMKKDERTSVSMARLRVGFKCGGSDGFSGITANPLVGRFCDELTAMGGTAVLTEVPEMFGAEQILMDRAKDRRQRTDRHSRKLSLSSTTSSIISHPTDRLYMRTRHRATKQAESQRSRTRASVVCRKEEGASSPVWQSTEKGSLQKASTCFPVRAMTLFQQPRRARQEYTSSSSPQDAEPRSAPLFPLSRSPLTANLQGTRRTGSTSMRAGF